MSAQGSPSSRLDALVRELEHAAAGLRDGQLSGEAAAAAVERCAELAARVGGELDLQARAAALDEPPGQEKLL